jgi:ankyrin repeat protein
MQALHYKYFGNKMTKEIHDLPPELRCEIYKRCDAESLFNFGNTPLQLAMRYRNHDIINVLKDAGAD